MTSTESEADSTADADALALADYRRQVTQMYARVRAAGSSEARGAWRAYRAARDRLFRDHPQSALTAAQREDFHGLPYFDYDPDLRLRAPLQPDSDSEVLRVTLDQDGETRLRRVGWLGFELAGNALRLALYWLEGYGGGLFLPFRDASNGAGTYAGGRYLLDTIKGADLGTEDGMLVLDFNYAYNPSCAYDPRWHCPLPPPENWLPVAIEAGEKDFTAGEAGPPRQDAVPIPERD